MEPAVPPASLFDWQLPVERPTVRVTPPAKQTRRGILRFRKDYELAILKARRIPESFRFALRHNSVANTRRKWI